MNTAGVLNSARNSLSPTPRFENIGSLPSSPVNTFALSSPCGTVWFGHPPLFPLFNRQVVRATDARIQIQKYQPRGGVGATSRGEPVFRLGRPRRRICPSRV